MRKTLRLIVLVVLLALMLGIVAYAQDDSISESLPTDLSDLKAPAGLSVVVVVVMGLLKRAGKFGEWIQGSPMRGFGMSLAVGGVVLALVYLVEYFGVYDIAQGFWLNFGVMWSVSQAFYNTQKVATTGVRAALDA